MLDLFEQPIFSAYLKMVQLPDEVKKQNGIKVGASVPRFDLVAVSGYFAPLESVKSERDGHIHFYLTNGGDGVDVVNGEGRWRNSGSVGADQRLFNSEGGRGNVFESVDGQCHRLAFSRAGDG